MSIYGAMHVGVSGLRAQGIAVSKISDNVANAGTTGYKRNFVEMVTRTSSSGGEQSAEGVMAVSTKEMDKQGGYQVTARETDLAVAGDGYFIVAKRPNETVQTNFFLTRAGSFRPDKDGYLVNAAGYYLHGYPTDQFGDPGTVNRNTFTDLVAIDVQQVQMQSSATTYLEMKGNMPSQETGLAVPGNPFVSFGEYYTALGEKETLLFTWQPTTTDSEWDVTLTDDAGTPFGTMTVTFNDSGPNAGTPLSYTAITNTAAAPASFAFNAATGVATITVDNGTSPQTINVEFGAPGSSERLTQFQGDYYPAQFSKDGSSVGALERVEFGVDGLVTGVFDNGATNYLYEIPLGQVENPYGLKEEDGNVFILNRESGGFSMVQPQSGSAGKIESYTLEQSNVDIAEELTQLIQAQRLYSSAAKIITTADELMQTTENIKR